MSGMIVEGAVIPLPACPGWLLLAIVLVVSIAAVSPQQLPVALYKTMLITLAGVVGCWLDREAIPLFAA